MPLHTNMNAGGRLRQLAEAFHSGRRKVRRRGVTRRSLLSIGACPMRIERQGGKLPGRHCQTNGIA